MTTSVWHPAFVGVGSNLDSPADQVRSGIELLDKLKDTEVIAVSGFYRSAPMGEIEQEDFVNAVVELRTRLGPGALLEQLRATEDQQGRDRSVERWGPRVLDLDLLAFDSLTIDEAHLKVPHPGIAERNFVLLPWAEIAPGFRVPGLKRVAELAREAPAEPQIERLD